MRRSLRRATANSLVPCAPAQWTLSCQRGILQTMTHGERKMTMPTWPVRFDGVLSEVKSAPLLGEHTEEVLADWLGRATTCE